MDKNQRDQDSARTSVRTSEAQDRPDTRNPGEQSTQDSVAASKAARER